MGKRKGSREASPHGKVCKESKPKSSVVAGFEVKPRPTRISAFSRYAKEKPEESKPQIVQTSEQSDSKSSSCAFKQRKKSKSRRYRRSRNVKTSEQDSSQDEAEESIEGHTEHNSDNEVETPVKTSSERLSVEKLAIHEEDGANSESISDVAIDVIDAATYSSPGHEPEHGLQCKDHTRKSSRNAAMRSGGRLEDHSPRSLRQRDSTDEGRGEECSPKSQWRVNIRSTSRGDRNDDRREEDGSSRRQQQGDNRNDRRGDRNDSRRKRHTSGHRALNIRTFPIDAENKCVLVSKLPGTFSVWGCASVCSLLGDVDVCGFILHPGAAPVDIFSPSSTSFITITTTLCTTLRNDLTKSVSDLPGMTEEVRTQILATVQKDSIVLVFGGTTTKDRLDFVTSVSPFQQIFWSKENAEDNADFIPLGSLPIAVAMDPGVKHIRISQEMKRVGEQFCASVQKGEMPSIAVCGGKNVGKSTMCRYLTNSALNKCHQVAYLECDVGQTEYSPPGCVSLHLIPVPTLGPPFTHQCQPHKMLYFGAVTPGDDPQFYLQCIKAAMAAYTALQEPCPLVINTMGWNQGLGLILLASTLSFTRPKYVTQIESDNRNRNLPPVTVQFVMEQDRWPTMLAEADEATPTHDLLKVHSVVDFNEFHDKYHPADHRTLSLLGYLSRCQPRSGPCTPLHAITPQTVAWRDVAVHVANAAVPNTQVMYALNASIVGLCRVPEHTLLSSDDESLPKFLAEKPLCECLGFGIIRAINPDRKVFHIVTELSLAESGVNCLLRAGLQVPHNLITNQPLVDDEMPYYGESKDVHGATAIKRRRHMTRRGRTGEQHKQ